MSQPTSPVVDDFPYTYSINEYEYTAQIYECNLPSPHLRLEGPADPYLVASFGPLRLLWHSSRQTHVIGRAPDCDLVLSEHCDLTSTWHQLAVLRLLTYNDFRLEALRAWLE